MKEEITSVLLRQHCGNKLTLPKRTHHRAMKKKFEILRTPSLTTDTATKNA